MDAEVWLHDPTGPTDFSPDDPFKPTGAIG